MSSSADYTDELIFAPAILAIKFDRKKDTKITVNQHIDLIAYNNKRLEENPKIRHKRKYLCATMIF